MLKIVNLLKKNELVKIFNKNGNTIYKNKREVPFNKEWLNSIYTFNKNTIRFVPAVQNYVLKLLRSYFNMYNENMEMKSKSPRHLSINKIWISTPEIKHLNKKAIITIYLYNRLYNKYKKQLDLLEFTWGPKIKIYNKKTSNNLSLIPEEKFWLFKHEYPIYLNIDKIIDKQRHTFYVKIIKWLKLYKYNKIGKYKLAIINFTKTRANTLKKVSIIKNERYNYLINQFKKELVYFKLKQKIVFNKFKYNEIYLNSLTNILQNIYKKKIELNIIMLRHYYYSSSIISQIVTAKIKNVKNRGKAPQLANTSFNNIGIRIPNLSRNEIPRVQKLSIGIKNIILNKSNVNENDLLNEFLLTNNSKIWSSKYVDNLAMKNIENKYIAGIFIKLKGRLTKRYKAQRAIKYLTYKGTLKNVYSAHKGYSSSLSRGYANINVDKTIINSKVRIGTFGVTGWVSSY